MDLKNCLEFSVVKNERTYTLHVPNGGTWDEIYSVAYEILDTSSKRMREIAEKVAPKEVSDVPQDN